MLPPVHPPLAYLVYRGLLEVDGRRPTATATVALVLGSILPDLIDQPLYVLGAVEGTRALGHSLLWAAPLCLGAWLVVSRSPRHRAIALWFIVGYATHLAADALWPVLFWAPGELDFLIWPLRPAPEYETVRALGEVLGVTVTTRWIEIGIGGAGLVQYWRDGMPGLEQVLP